MTRHQNFELMMSYLRIASRFNADLPPGCSPADLSWFEANAIGWASR